MKNIDRTKWVPARGSTIFELFCLTSFSQFHEYYQSDWERFLIKLLKFYSIILKISYSNMLNLFEEQNKDYRKILQYTYSENDTLSVFDKKFDKLVTELRLPSIDTLTIRLEDIKKFKEMLEKQ